MTSMHSELQKPSPVPGRPVELKEAEKPRFSLGTFVERHIAYFLIAPTILGIAVVNVYPLLDTVRLSFTNRLLSRPEEDTRFIGLDNYTAILTSPGVWNAFKVSLI